MRQSTVAMATVVLDLQLGDVSATESPQLVDVSTTESPQLQVEGLDAERGSRAFGRAVAR